jgi:hypothetical protein
MSNTIRNRPLVIVVAMAIAAGLVATLAAFTSGGQPVAQASTSEASRTTTSTSAPPRHRPGSTIEVDVAENHTRFHFDEAPVFDDGFPSEGNSFVTAGYLYPAGTLSADEDGVNEDGSPAYPDLVIGEWLCRGYFIGEGAHATEGSWVFSTQLFSFGDDPTAGTDTIVVVGYEGAGIGESVTGAITGGSGAFQAAFGEATQELLGFTLFEGNDDDMPIKKRVTLHLTHARP